MRSATQLFLLMLLFAIVGCSKSNSSSSDERSRQENFQPKQAAMMMAEAAPTQARGGYLAYEHSTTLELPEAEMKPAFDRIVEHCQQTASNCTVMHSELQTGNYANGYLKFRVLPKDVPALDTFLTTLGKTIHKSTDVDDLQDAIVDSGKRIELLQNYQQRLLKLEQEASKDIESLIRVASELSQVQSNLEYALGEKARLLQRVNLDIVNIRLQSLTYTGFWSPIVDAFDEFGENLSDATATFITAFAYILPWLALFIIMFIGFRFFWRRRSK